MADEGTTTAKAQPTPTTTPTNVGATTTREQHRRNNAEHDAIDDGEKTQSENKRKDKDSTFLGKVSKMSGNVFQLAEEGRKGNQFTQTLEALYDYAAIELEHATDLAPLFETPCKAATIKEPDDQPPMSSDQVNRVTRDHRLYIAWKFECESYNSRVVALAANQHKLFTVMLLQCSQSVKMKVEGAAGYDAAKQTHNCKWLITTLKGICHKFEHTENRFVALVNAKGALFNCRQGQTQSINDYFESFKELLSILESYGGQLHDPATAAPDSTDFTNLTTTKEKDTYMRDRYSAALFLRNSDNVRFATLKTELSNDFNKGRDEYPATLTEAHQRLLSYKGPTITVRPPTNNNTNQQHPPDHRVSLIL